MGGYSQSMSLKRTALIALRALLLLLSCRSATDATVRLHSFWVADLQQSARSFCRVAVRVVGGGGAARPGLCVRQVSGCPPMIVRRSWPFSDHFARRAGTWTESRAVCAAIRARPCPGGRGLGLAGCKGTENAFHLRCPRGQLGAMLARYGAGRGVLLPSSLRASWHWTLQQQQAVPQCSVARRLSVISEWLKWIIADFGTIERAQNSKRAGSTMDASTPPQGASWTRRTGTLVQRLCILRARGRGHPGPARPCSQLPGPRQPASCIPHGRIRCHKLHIQRQWDTTDFVCSICKEGIRLYP